MEFFPIKLFLCCDVRFLPLMRYIYVDTYETERIQSYHPAHACRVAPLCEGSHRVYSEDIIRTVDGNCRIFYIRTIHSASMYSRIQDIREESRSLSSTLPPYAPNGQGRQEAGGWICILACRMTNFLLDRFIKRMGSLWERRLIDRNDNPHIMI